ncbi:hypothetical protein N7460_005416 [Penicillium canescens]|uniref:Uncharacterized protein n=1 Tax=Penicillium canescens TaxID=5083 RepID=A0AAD6IED9_PENCN|nr:hypothetical protein N7460_005416 [Penicillium canescens]
MGKAGRMACIFTPYVLTIASLICIIMVGLGCTNASSSTLNNLYFLRLDISNITASSETTTEIENALRDAGITSVTVDDLTSAIETIENESGLADYYDIGLWGYCEGDISGSKKNITSCSKPKAEFYFDPLSLFGLENTNAASALGTDAKKIMNVYKAVSKWMFIAYLVAFIATCAQILVGIFAICSRWGSCVTTMVSIVAFLFTLGASLTSTIMFSIAKGSLGTAARAYGVKVSMGTNIYAATWLAVVFSLAGTLFWMFSTCCCSGRSPYGHKNRGNARGSVTAEKAPYTYEPIGAGHPPFGSQPYAQGHNTAYPPPPAHHNDIPMTNQRQNAYEPFRHV